jgi:hypothetical protein
MYELSPACDVYSLALVIAEVVEGWQRWYTDVPHGYWLVPYMVDPEGAQMILATINASCLVCLPFDSNINSLQHPVTPNRMPPSWSPVLAAVWEVVYAAIMAPTPAQRPTMRQMRDALKQALHLAATQGITLCPTH